MHKAFVGKWRITHMDEWDTDFVDMVVPGYIRFGKDNTGEFQFGCVHGFMDCRNERHDSGHRVEFSWDGNDEMQAVEDGLK